MEKLELAKRIKIDETNIINTSFGILGDIPGYGKSFSLIALILRDKMDWDVKEDHNIVNINSYGDFMSVARNIHRKRIKTSKLINRNRNSTKT
jgi:hypothetical protein